jgi:hypothetical protein
MSSSNNNQDFEFNRDKQEFSLTDKNSSENPFLQNSNTKNSASEPNYEVSNERIKDNKKQSKGLAKMLLALLLATGIIIAAILGLISKNQASINPNQNINANALDTKDKNTNKTAFKWPWQKNTNNSDNNLPNTDSQSPNNPTNNKVATLNPSFNLPVFATDNTESNPNVCKLSESQKYIAESINNLDRVVGLAENKLDDLNASPPADQVKQAEFLKTKVNDLSKVESDIYAFSEPHLDKDSSTLNFDDLNASCKINDGPKYLNAWLDELSERIKALDVELSYLSSAESSAATAITTDNNTIANNNIQTPPKPVLQPAETPKNNITNNTNTKANIKSKDAPIVNKPPNNIANNTNTKPNIKPKDASIVNKPQNNITNNTNTKANIKSKDAPIVNKPPNNITNNTNNNIQTPPKPVLQPAETPKNNITNNTNTKANIKPKDSPIVNKAQKTNILTENKVSKNNNTNISNNLSSQKTIKIQEKIIPNYISIVPTSKPVQKENIIEKRVISNNIPSRLQNRTISRYDNNIRQPRQEHYNQTLQPKHCISDFDQEDVAEYDYYEEYVYEDNDYN